jgi:hypothetical protein
VIRAGFEKCSDVSGELFAEQKRVFTWDKLSQPAPSLHQWEVAQILAVQIQEIKGAEN